MTAILTRPPKSVAGTTRRSDDVTRLLPKPLLVVVTTILLLIVLVPVLYIVLASVNSDISVASGAFFPVQFNLDNYVMFSCQIDKGLDWR